MVRDGRGGQSWLREDQGTGQGVSRSGSREGSGRPLQEKPRALEGVRGVGGVFLLSEQRPGESKAPSGLPEAWTRSVHQGRFSAAPSPSSRVTHWCSLFQALTLTDGQASPPPSCPHFPQGGTNTLDI